MHGWHVEYNVSYPNDLNSIDFWPVSPGAPGESNRAVPGSSSVISRSSQCNPFTCSRSHLHSTTADHSSPAISSLHRKQHDPKSRKRNWSWQLGLFSLPLQPHLQPCPAPAPWTLHRCHADRLSGISCTIDARPVLHTAFSRHSSPI
jgi:hypothetical protein